MVTTSIDRIQQELMYIWNELTSESQLNTELKLLS